MDKVKAASWEAELKGRDVAGYVVESLIDFGKSAAVFKASHQGAPVALKLFDDELIERYGDKAQLARIERELTLIGKHHPNMVRIIDGGFDKKSENHFIVMEFLPGRSLEKCLQDVPESNIPLLIGQLASCCEYLESLTLVHRDIKPANIVILDDYSRLVLLDFGVMKPVGEVGVTDVGGIQSFIGTLQYSSPEFLLRQEDDSIEGWRALSLYQIGGVLHDLIMRRPLFQEYANPYARLVMAVQQDYPLIASSTLPTYIMHACKAALVKDWHTRLKLVSWSSFKPPEKRSMVADARERVTQRSLINEAIPVQQGPIGHVSQDLREAVINLLKIEARRVRNGNATAFPPLTVTRAPTESGALLIHVRAAAAQTIAFGLTMELQVVVIDPQAQAVGVSLGAWLGSPQSRPELVSEVTAFEGIFVPSSLSALLESAMYLSLDQAQSTTGFGEGFELDLSDLERVL